MKSKFNEIISSKPFTWTLAIIVIILICADIVYPLISVIAGFFSKEIFLPKEMSTYADLIVNAHAKMLSLIVITLLMSLMFKKTTIITISASIIVAFFLNPYEFMDSVIHAFLLNIGLYNNLLINNIKEINPQYTRITIFSTLFFVFTILMFSKKYRNIDRSFIWLICFVSAVVIFLFHIAIPMGMLKYTKNERFEQFKIENSYKKQEELCSKYLCLTENSEELTSNNNLLLSNSINRVINTMKDPSFKYKIWVGQNGDFIGTEYIFYICKKENNIVTCAIDSKAMKDYGKQSLIWFAFLTTFAQTVWFVFGIILLLIHKKHLTKRIFNPN